VLFPVPVSVHQTRKHTLTSYKKEKEQEKHNREEEIKKTLQEHRSQYIQQKR